MKTFLLFISVILSISCIAYSGNFMQAVTGVDHHNIKWIVCTLIITIYTLALSNHSPASINQSKTAGNNHCSSLLNIYPGYRFDIISRLIGESMKYQFAKLA